MLNTSKFSPEVQKTIKNMEERLEAIKEEKTYLEEILRRFE